MPIGVNFNFIITLMAASVTLFLGVLVYFHDRTSATNKIFFRLSFVGFIWAFANYFSISVAPENALFWIRGVIFLAAPHVFLFWLFVHNFPQNDLLLNKKLRIIFCCTLGITMLIAASPLGFSKLISSPTNFSKFLPAPGPLMPIFGLILIALTAYTIFLILLKYFRSDESGKKQWLYIGVGLLIAYPLLIGLVFIRVNFFGDSSFVPYSPLFLLPIFLGAAFAIIKYNLFHVKVISTEILVFLILLVSFVQVIAAESLLSRILSISTTLFVLFLGVFLIKSVIKEVKAREEIERLAKDLEKANEQLKKLDQLKSEFLSFASHQLRSPLTAIKGYASMILEGTYGKVTEKTKEPVDRIFQSSNALATMVEDFLNISKIEQGGMKYDFQMTDFKKLIETVVAEQEPNIASKKLKIVFSAQEGINYNLKMDASKIKQVVMNLIDNSVKYTPKGSIALSLRTIDRKIQLEIKDTGIGFNKETLPKLFAKFSRQKNANKVNIQGSGLGLYLAKEIMEAHHGHIWAQSPGEGRGASFFVEFYTDLIIGS